MSAESEKQQTRNRIFTPPPEPAEQSAAWTSVDRDSDHESDVDMFCCHRVQDSLLSSSSRFTDYRGILNWIIILLVLTHAHLFLENFIQHGFLIDLRKVLEHLMEDNYNWPSVYMILAANVFAVIALLLEKFQDKGILTFRAGHYLHVTNLLLLTVFPPAVILHHDKCISTGGALLSLSIYTTLGLKLYSYQEVNCWYRQEGVRSEGVQRCMSPEGNGGGSHLSMKDLYYFLLAPTLCYQRDFPRTPSIRINFLLRWMLEMVMLTQLMVGIMQQWVGPIFQSSETSFSNMDATTRIEHLVELVAPSHFLWLILFFLFSHSCLNLSGELLRFGDRQFYGDWWNAETLESFWRKWNVPFHKWTYRHLYKPLLRRNISPWQADLLIFLLSAAFCEYVIAMSLRTCRFWIFFLMILELLVAEFLGHHLTGNYGNGFVWLCLLLGPPLAVMMYFHDYYMGHRSQPHWSLL
ncbi:diacylglycerol O-acyltransferase 1-like isoform X1 [Brienomyrus brachyistius]|uniref:diacylglycerol O-acyltransferase 1-like isoform X1 n=1 Tax=Brienomyrus brachyistius TaxID=42636 RepID=UPI0020B441CF|nr:diacylglycerol O-acyltransferase 1-like isoform X1 [Brienomyrus brachyistius]XP_048829657.1 diacylglycerol O-acyltransferase 1-like isoform X1 [Brienomyrus brachyistius]XP_048829658.1 diacylglycerol O-acyltransferase 1-like isoform X1 [Brienomyrus brachyistius]XP_048829659.1 diacylglycerol O-acyltransferase 1-like isoform X1 [Brienomyrus brachyistius]XP_048829660.1 diacylglycerol O-acyltransferase 1-like isoform X1 [Brienomyrus brachyistius]XP_048829661.1 diacylglycerol O-acyltransferase 1-